MTPMTPSSPCTRRFVHLAADSSRAVRKPSVVTCWRSRPNGMPTRTTATATSTMRSSYLASGRSLRAVASGNPASIAATVTATPSGETTDAYEGNRRLLLGLAAARVVLALVAVPLAPFLYEDHVALL